jgi:hypothetical protein
VVKRKGFLVAGGLSILPELIDSWAPFVDIPPEVTVLGKGFGPMFPILGTHDISRFLWKLAEVTKAVICASLAGYLLLAGTRSYLHLMIEKLLTGSCR